MALRLKSAPRRESKNTNNPPNTKTFKIKFRKMWIIFRNLRISPRIICWSAARAFLITVLPFLWVSMAISESMS